MSEASEPRERRGAFRGPRERAREGVWRGAAPQLKKEGGSNSVVESQPSKLLVAGSIPVSRSSIFRGASAPRTPPRRRSLGLRASLRSGGRSRCSRFRVKTKRWMGVSRTSGYVGASEPSERATRTERAGEAASERACRGVWRGEAPQKADVAQLAERVLGKDEVTSSILVIGSNLRSRIHERASVGKPAGRRRLGRPKSARAAGTPAFG